MPIFLIFTITLKVENSILDSIRDNFGFSIIRMPFYCSNVPIKFNTRIQYEIILASALYGCHFTVLMSLSKCSIRPLEQSILEFLKQPVKLDIFLVIIKSNVKTKGTNEDNHIFLSKNIQRHEEVFIKYNKSIVEIMQAIGF